MAKRHVPKTGDPKIDFPEMFENEIENVDEDMDDIDQLKEIGLQNDFIHKQIVEDIKQHAEVKPDGIYDKRLKRPLLKRIFDALFNNDSV